MKKQWLVLVGAAVTLGAANRKRRAEWSSL
jgi:hypothetical protein